MSQEEGAPRRVERMMEEAYGGISSDLCEPSEGCLKPLYRIEVDENYVTVTFDMPGAKKDEIRVSATEEMLAVEARLVEPVALMMGGPLQRKVSFTKYMRRIRLPAKVDPERASATYSKGLLSIRFPLERGGKAISIE
ncbi:MAG: hypothetical protein C4339_01345 [Nitrososphaerota archaeon]